MAQIIMLRHPSTGIEKQGFHGFSWTTLFFGALPALFRQDFLTFIGALVIMVALGSFTLGIGALIAMVIWAFMYNKYYTRKLIERGYIFVDTPARIAAACSALGVSPPKDPATSTVPLST